MANACTPRRQWASKNAGSQNSVILWGSILWEMVALKFSFAAFDTRWG